MAKPRASCSTGRPAWAMSCRCWTCAPTTRVPASATTAPSATTSRCRPSSPKRSKAWPASSRPACSWSCWPAGRRCCTATAARPTSASACPMPTARAWKPRVWSASSSTPRCCARNSTAACHSCSCWPRCARPPWTPRPTRTCRSSNWSKPCPKPVSKACSRSCSTTSNATCRPCAACRACWPKSCRGTAAKPSSTCSCTVKKTTRAA
ncbi:hypothetical protein D9M71_624230 [compost metagenome]